MQLSEVVARFGIHERSHDALVDDQAKDGEEQLRVGQIAYLRPTAFVEEVNLAADGTKGGEKVFVATKPSDTTAAA